MENVSTLSVGTLVIEVETEFHRAFKIKPKGGKIIAVDENFLVVTREDGETITTPHTLIDLVWRIK